MSIQHASACATWHRFRVLAAACTLSSLSASAQIEVGWTGGIEAQPGSTGEAYFPWATYWHDAGTCSVDPWGNLAVVAYGGGYTRARSEQDTVLLNPPFPASGITVARYLKNGAVGWAFRLGAADFNAVCGVTTDHQGSIWVAMQHRSAMDVDPGPGVANIPMGDNNDDLLIVKYDSAGNYLHAIPLVTNVNNTATIQISRMGVDASDNVFVCGYYQTSIDVDGGPGQTLLTSSGFNTCGFVAKYDPQGNLLDHINIRSYTYGADAMDVVVRDDGGFSVIGTFRDSIDMDPGPGTTLLTGNSDEIYVASYDAAFGLQWARTFATTGNAQGHLACAGPNGDLIISARFNYDITVPVIGQGTLSLSGGFFHEGQFIASLNDAGDVRWFRSLPYTSNTIITGLSTADDSTFMLQFNYSGSLNLDPGVTEQTVTTGAFPNTDMGFARYRMADGGLVMAHVFNNAGGINYLDLEMFGTSMYMAGQYSGTLNVDIPSGPNTFTSQYSALAIVKYCFVPENITISPAADTVVVCPASDTLLVASGAEHFLWYDEAVGGAPFASGDSLVLTAIDATRVVYLEGINDACAAQRVPITLLVRPQIELSVDSIAACAGDTVLLAYTGAADLFATNVPSAFTSGFVPSNDIAIWMQATDINAGCSVSDTARVVVLPLPDVSLVLDIDSICLFGAVVPLSGGSPAGGAWSGEGVVGSLWSPFESGPGLFYVHYTVTGANGCDASAADTMDVEFCFDAIESGYTNATSGPLIYPQPASASFFVTLDAHSGLCSLTLFDGSGRRVKSIEGRAAQVEFNVADLAPGRYVLQLDTAQGRSFHRPVVIAR